MRVTVLRQLMLHPLARDARIRGTWSRGSNSAKGVKWSSLLAGNDDVLVEWYDKRVLWPRDRPTRRYEPRFPTAICVNVLFQLLRQCDGDGVLTFPSMRQMGIRLMLVKSGGTKVYDGMMDALRMWQVVGVTFGDLRLSPPIRSMVPNDMGRVRGGKQAGFGFRIEMDAEWVRLCRVSKCPSVLLPLPGYATPQNMVLWTLLHGVKTNLRINPWIYKLSGAQLAVRPGSVAQWIPYSSWLVVKEWYKSGGGSIEYRRQPHTLHQMGRHRASLKASDRFHIVKVDRPTRAKHACRNTRISQSSAAKAAEAIERRMDRKAAKQMAQRMATLKASQHQ